MYNNINKGCNWWFYGPRVEYFELNEYWKKCYFYFYFLSNDKKMWKKILNKSRRARRKHGSLSTRHIVLKRIERQSSCTGDRGSRASGTGSSRFYCRGRVQRSWRESPTVYSSFPLFDKARSCSIRHVYCFYTAELFLCIALSVHR